MRNIWDLELLDDTFERPADVDALVAANRDTRKVTVVVPKSSKRTYEGLIQDLRVTSEDEQPDGYRKLELELQQPFAQRMAMFLFRAGPHAFVVSPPDLEDAAAEQARQLLAHHGLA